MKPMHHPLWIVAVGTLLALTCVGVGCQSLSFDRIDHFHNDNYAKRAADAQERFNKFTGDSAGLEPTLLKNVAAQTTLAKVVAEVRANVDDDTLALRTRDVNWLELRDQLFQAVGLLPKENVILGQDPDKPLPDITEADKPPVHIINRDDRLKAQAYFDQRIGDRITAVNAIANVLQAIMAADQFLGEEAKKRVAAIKKQIDANTPSGDTTPDASDDDTASGDSSSTSSKAHSTFVDTLLDFRKQLVIAGRTHLKNQTDRSAAHAIEQALLEQAERSRDPASAYALAAIFGSGLDDESMDALAQYLSDLNDALAGLQDEVEVIKAEKECAKKKKSSGDCPEEDGAAEAAGTAKQAGSFPYRSAEPIDRLRYSISLARVGAVLAVRANLISKANINSKSGPQRAPKTIKSNLRTKVLERATEYPASPAEYVPPNEMALANVTAQLHDAVSGLNHVVATTRMGAARQRQLTINLSALSKVKDAKALNFNDEMGVLDTIRAISDQFLHLDDTADRFTLLSDSGQAKGRSLDEAVSAVKKALNNNKAGIGDIVKGLLDGDTKVNDATKAAQARIDAIKCARQAMAKAGTLNPNRTEILNQHLRDAKRALNEAKKSAAEAATDAKVELGKTLLDKLFAANPKLAGQIDEAGQTVISTENLAKVGQIISDIGTQEQAAQQRVLQYFSELYQAESDLFQENIRHMDMLGTVAEYEVRRWTLLSDLSEQYSGAYTGPREEDAAHAATRRDDADVNARNAEGAAARPATAPATGPASPPATAAATAQTQPAISNAMMQWTDRLKQRKVSATHGSKVEVRKATQKAKNTIAAVKTLPPTENASTSDPEATLQDLAGSYLFLEPKDIGMIAGFTDVPPGQGKPPLPKVEGTDTGIVGAPLQIKRGDPVLFTVRKLADTSRLWQNASPAQFDPDGKRLRFAYDRLELAVRTINGHMLMLSMHRRLADDNAIRLGAELAEHEVHIDSIERRAREASFRLSLGDLRAFHDTGITQADLQLIGDIALGVIAGRVKK